MSAPISSVSSIRATPNTLADRRIAFIGGGVMATAILRSLVDAGRIWVGQVVVSDPLDACREQARGLGAAVTGRNSEAVAGADVVLLAVKPQDLPAVLAEVGPILTSSQFLVSIAPGFRTAQIEAQITPGVPVIRVMPNTPLLVGEGASGFCRGAHAGDDHAAVAQQLLSAGGRCVEVPEKLMDAVTGLSGSGPAYVFLVIEALADGGVRMGLPRATALTLAAQTVLGAARLVLESGEHPAVLKDRVATPAGTTIAGLAAMEEAGVRSGLIRAVEAATRRSEEMGRPKDG